MRRPRLNALRTFEAAGHNLSFSLAARKLHITQAAVSQQIRNLEAYLDEPLFTRSHRQITLTGKGRIYLEAVHQALNQLDTVTDQLFDRRPNEVVSIHCTSSIATLWIAPQIHLFQKANPDINLLIRTLEHEGETRTSNAADLEIFVSAKADNDPDVTPLMTSFITPVAAPDYLAAHQPHRAQDIQNCNLIHILGYDDDWHRWFATYNPDTRQIPRGLSADSSLFAIDAALRGDGVFLGRRPFINAHLESGRLVEVFQVAHHLKATYYLRHQKTGASTPNTVRVAAWLQQIAREAAI